MSLVQGGDKGMPNEKAVGMTAIVGVVKNIQSRGLSKEVLHKIYNKVIQGVYHQGEEASVQEKRTVNVPSTPVRKIPPRQAKSLASPPKKYRGTVMESLCEGVRTFLVKINPTNQKVVCDPRLGQKVWCYKHAFSRGSDCVLAYCGSCKGNYGRTGRGGGERQ